MKIDIYLNAEWVATVGSFKLAAHLICHGRDGMNDWCQSRFQFSGEKEKLVKSEAIFNTKTGEFQFSGEKEKLVKARLRGEDVGVSIKIGDEIIWNSLHHVQLDIGSQFWVIKSLDLMVENGIYYGGRVATNGQPSYTDWKKGDTIDSMQERDEEDAKALIARSQRVRERLEHELGRTPTLDETVDRMSQNISFL